MSNVVHLGVVQEKYGRKLPEVDLEAVRTYVNGIPALRLESIATSVWEDVRRGAATDVPYALYVVAYIASRLADERLLEGRDNRTEAI